LTACDEWKQHSEASVSFSYRSNR